MKSGASRISKHIRLFPVVRWGDGRKMRAFIIQGTALSPRPDHLQPNRIGSGTMRCRKRVSERLQRASAHYATRTAFLLQEKRCPTAVVSEIMATEPVEFALAQTPRSGSRLPWETLHDRTHQCAGSAGKFEANLNRTEEPPRTTTLPFFVCDYSINLIFFFRIIRSCEKIV